MTIRIRLMLSLLQDIRDMIQVCQAHGSMELRVLTVDADTVEVFESVMPEIAKVGHLFEDFRLSREDCPSFYGMVYFCCMEAARGYIAIAEDGATVYFDTESMRPVVDHFEVMFFCDLIDRLHIAGNPIDMRGKDARGFWRDRRFDFGRIDIAGSGIDVDKNRFASFPDDAARGGYVGKRRGNNLTCEVQGFDGDLNGDSPVAGIEQMLDVQIFLETKLQFVDQRTVVGQPVALPYPIEVGLIFGLRRKEGFGDGDQILI